MDVLKKLFLFYVLGCFFKMVFTPLCVDVFVFFVLMPSLYGLRHFFSQKKCTEQFFVDRVKCYWELGWASLLR